MELDSVNGNGYQGSSTTVNIKPVQPEVNDIVEVDSVTIITDEMGGASTADINIANQPNEITNNVIKKMISEINSKLNKNTEAVFGIHDETNRVTIKIIDKDSKEIIKEIPPEKTLEMIAKIWEIAGLLVDEKL
jgi:flagellar protein FlaG